MVLNVGALIMRIGFGVCVTILYFYKGPQHSIGNYLGPYSSIFMSMDPETPDGREALLRRSAAAATSRGVNGAEPAG